MQENTAGEGILKTGWGARGKRESNDGGRRRNPTYKEKVFGRRVSIAIKNMLFASVYDVMLMDHCRSTPYQRISLLPHIHLFAFARLVV